MLFLLYAVVFANGVGLFRFPPPAGGIGLQDVCYGLLLVLTAPAYLRQRQTLGKPFRAVEMAWLLFVTMLALSAVSSPALYRFGSLANLRLVAPYMLFFPTVAILESKSRLQRLIALGIFVALLGSILTVIQSIHGITNITDSALYETGRWAGQRMYVGSIARVNLPISIWISCVFLGLISATALAWRWWQLPLLAILLMPIILNFARSMWLGLALAVITQLTLFALYQKIKFNLLLRFSIASVVLVGTIRVVGAEISGLGSLEEQILFRLSSGIENVTNQSGTFGSRMDLVIPVGLQLWQTSPVFGLGLTFLNQVELPFLVDVGLIYVLVLVGVVGLLVIAGLFLTAFVCGIQICRNQAEVPDNNLIAMLGASLAATVVFIFTYQAWLDPWATTSLAVASALAVVAAPLLGASAHEDDISEPMILFHE